MAQRRWAAVFSSLIMIVSILTLCVHGLNLGLDFTGGTQVDMRFSHGVDVGTLRQRLQQAGFEKVLVQSYDAEHISIRVANLSNNTQSLRTRLLSVAPDGVIERLDYLGPQVSNQLWTNGILAIIVALLATMTYIALRFEFRFAVSAAIALLHDPILILGVFSFFHLEFNLIVLAAVLTVIGYSLNDTIVVYDRVRENFRKIRKGTPAEIMDLSINQTLSRTIMTSGLTLLVVIALLIFGGPTLRPFALALTIGIVIGTYSSIYVAGSLAIAFGLNRTHLMKSKKAYDDGLP